MSSYKFITFGDGGQNFFDATNRLCSQAKSLDLFDLIEGHSFETLFDDFKEAHHDFIMNNKRGFGYWIWKPYIINRLIDCSNDGDKILYADCGCELSTSKKDVLKQMLVDTKWDIRDSIVREREKGVPGTNLMWTKPELIDYLGLSRDDDILLSRQHQASALMIMVNQKTRSFISHWSQMCQKYSLIDDSTMSDGKEYKEHRHDQSIYNLLFEFHKNLVIQSDIRDGVYIVRNKTGKVTRSV